MSNELLKKIRYSNVKLPEEELKKIINNEEEYKELLFDIIKNYDEKYVIEKEDEVEDSLYLVALIILAYYKDKRVFPYLNEVLKLSYNNVEKYMSGLFTEYLSNIISSLYEQEHKELFFDIIENEKIEVYIRTAALFALPTLYLKGYYSFDFLKEYLKKTLDKNFENEIIVRSVAYIADDFKIKELSKKLNEFIVLDEDDREEVQKAINSYHENIEKEIDIEDINKFYTDITEPLNFLDKNIYYELDNEILNEMREMVKQYKELLLEEKILTEENRKLKLKNVYLNSVLNELELKNSVNKETRISAKIGRNEPCPCGSGKKYKKCCLNN